MAQGRKSTGPGGLSVESVLSGAVESELGSATVVAASPLSGAAS